MKCSKVDRRRLVTYALATALTAIVGCGQQPPTAEPSAARSTTAVAAAPTVAKTTRVPTASATASRARVVMMDGPSPTPKATTAATDSELCYRWQNGQQYSYRVEFAAEIGDTVLGLSGTNTYTAGRPPESRSFASGSEGRQGSGTAFVISSDGYLVTCDHVVRGATDIKVTLGKELVPCEIVARDSAHDVAVIRVERKGLPALPLADSEAVDLAEDVRAIGYPLSDVLGSTVKVTQGSISGIVSKPRGKVFQIDAVVNPGNSGGPLLDARGVVVGVVNAQLVGFEISKVGFAVPINYAKKLLAERHVKFETVGADARLDGPALAKRVTPSVVLVTMTCHGDDFSDDDRPSLYYHGMLERRQWPRTDEPAAAKPAAAESSQRDDGRLVVDEVGEVSHFDGQVNFPCLVGPLGLAVIDALPASGETAWEREETISLNVSGRGAHDPLAGIRPPGFPIRQPEMPMPPPFFWHSEEPQPRSPATQKINYTLDKSQSGSVLIHKKLKLKTLEAPHVSPRLELSGTGETLFDLKLGVPKKITFSGKFVLREDGHVVQVPVTLLCELVSSGPHEIAKPAKTTAPVAVAEPAEAAKARLDALLADLRAMDKDWNKCFAALQALGMMKPIAERRDEVSDALDGYLTEKSYSARSSALRAVRTWGTRRNVPALIGLLSPSESDTVRRRAIEALGSFGDEQAAKAVAQRLTDASDRATAAQSLRALGRVAEGATITLLADPNPEVRNEVCKILADVGGAKSVSALKDELGKNDPATRGRAKAALDKLQEKH